MAVISLREYNREIDSLIDQGKTDDAVQHCKHILKFFPKHVDTYRLLGKSFLESQRFTEAADLFQRVLSVFPDDFISQIGLSIIREDEGNLDAAIWHIERAFEIQPSNAPIRDELRRLYGRRDGVQPPKVRLTRGALIRMYMQGQLYPQAIAEAKAALQEDTKRIDLEILLAKLYFLSGNRVDAINICSNIISKLPFCYEANKILAVILPGTSRSDSAKLFQRRIAAIQPYAAYVTKETSGIDQVPDNTVTLEKLDLSASDRYSSQPDWAQTIGVEIETPVSEEAPEWFSSVESKPEPETLSPALDANEIPDWMKDAGWELRDADEEEPRTFTGFDEEEAAEEEYEVGSITEAAPGDLPDWLKELSPEEPSENLFEEEIESEEKLTTLEDIFSQPETGNRGKELPEEKTSPVSLADEDSFQFENPELIGEIPDWLKGLENDLEAKEEGMTEETFNTELPSWLNDLKDQPIDSEDEKLAIEQIAKETGEPQWLNLAKEDSDLMPQTESSEDIEEETEISEWLDQLKETEASLEKDDIGTVIEESPEDELPEWMKTFEVQKQTEKPDSQIDQMEMKSGVSDIPEWLEFEEKTASIKENIQEKVAQIKEDEESPGESDNWINNLDSPRILTHEEKEEEPPSKDSELEDWLAGLDIDQFQKIEKNVEKDQEIPEWLQKLDTGKESIFEQDQEPTAQDNDQELLDFLNQLDTDTSDSKIIEPDTSLYQEEEAKEIEEKAEEEPETEPEIVSELPDWMRSIDEEIPPLKEEETEEKSEEIPESKTEDIINRFGLDKIIQQNDEIDDAIAWLESLSNNQEKEPEIEEHIQAVASDTDEITEEDLSNGESSSEELPLSEEIKEFNQPIRSFDSLIEETIIEEQGVPETVFQEPLEKHQLSAEEESYEEIKSVLEEEILLKEAAAEEKEEGDLDDYLQKIPPREISQEEMPSDMDIDQALAWLESLAVKQGVDEETLITSPESRLETPPDWVGKSPHLEEEPVEEILEDIKSQQSQENDNEVKGVKIRTSQAEEAEQISPDWLKQQAEQQDSIQETLRPGSFKRIKTPPDWIKKESENDADSSQKEKELEEKLISHNNQEKTIVAEISEDEQRESEIALFQKKIKTGKDLEKVISDIQNTIYHSPLDSELWQILGDAYFKAGNLEESLKAYNKAEELLQ